MCEYESSESLSFLNLGANENFNGIVHNSEYDVKLTKTILKVAFEVKYSCSSPLIHILFGTCRADFIVFS